MKIRKLYAAQKFPQYMVIETMKGEMKRFQVIPVRHIKESDLMPLPHFRPVGKNGEEAQAYMYKMYGLTK